MEKSNKTLELLKIIHIKPHKIDLYELALTHSSFNADAKTKHHDYERLEYMGDAVLGFVTADLIFEVHPEMDQGLMSKLRSYLVQSKALANYARKIELSKYIITGHSIEQEMLDKSDKILEDVFEALIGAIYLDQGIKKATSYIKSFIFNDIKFAKLDELTDYKTRLQEEMQSEHRDSVSYRLLKEEGPAHEKVFVSEVLFNDEVLAEGRGKTKKASEQDAAKNALKKKAIK
ncbi:MAG: ribonuclease III [Erysipelotrichaceae bacterium]|nr:ribonuclease III [Erysipelotrichaceae bacterium]